MLTLVQGDDFNLRLPVPDVQADDVANAEVRLWPGGPLLARFTTDVAVDRKEVRLSLAKADSAALKRSGVWDLELDGGAGRRTVISGGRMRLVPQVTTGTSPVRQRLTWAALSAMTWAEFRATRWGDSPQENVSTGNTDAVWGSTPWGYGEWSGA